MSRSDKHLELLDDFLAAVSQENLPITVSEHNGYVTSILACSHLILPSEWLPHVWGETSDAGFPDLATAEATISAVMAHYNAVASDMAKTPWIEPIYEVDPHSDETLWEVWIDGFTLRCLVQRNRGGTVCCAGPYSRSLCPQLRSRRNRRNCPGGTRMGSLLQ